MLLVSERLKQVIEAHLQSGLEFLPAKILNHKRKPAGDTYFAVNFTHSLLQQGCSLVSK